MPEQINNDYLFFEKEIDQLQQKIDTLKTNLDNSEEVEDVNLTKAIESLENKKTEVIKKHYNKLTPWQIVLLSRHSKRPKPSFYINKIFKDINQIHGDRIMKEDSSIFCGLANFNQKPIAVISHMKGTNMEENIMYNFGMPNPPAYRKSHRFMKLAEKFCLPIIFIIDTPGAFPGIEAEKLGQSQAIAENLALIASVRVPIIAIITGEGGSGGALAIGYGDKVFMLQYSIYSVISPEGCASILWKESSKAALAAQALSITAQDQLNLGIIDGIIPEPLGGAHRNPEECCENIKAQIQESLNQLNKISTQQLLKDRIKKIQKITLTNTQY